MSEASADALAVVAAESDQLGSALHDRGRLPVVGVERLSDAILRSILRDLDERVMFDVEEVEEIVSATATFALLVGVKLGMRRG